MLWLRDDSKKKKGWKGMVGWLVHLADKGAMKKNVGAGSKSTRTGSKWGVYSWARVVDQRDEASRMNGCDIFTLLLLRFSVFLFLLDGSCYFAIDVLVCVRLICSGLCCPSEFRVVVACVGLLVGCFSCWLWVLFRSVMSSTLLWFLPVYLICCWLTGNCFSTLYGFVGYNDYAHM